MADWTLGTDAEEHLVEHNLFDHVGIATPTAGKVLGVSGGKYTQVDASGGTGDHDALTGVSADDHHTEDHQARHQSGGADALSGNLDATARVGVRKNSAGSVFTRRRLNLIEGNNVTLTVADDAGSEEVDVTITASGGGTQYARLLVGNDTLDINDSTIVVSSDGASRIITLPQISTVPGIAYLIKRAGSNTVTVNRSGTDVLWTDGATAVTKALTTDGAQLGIVGLSGIWYVVAERGTIT